MHGRFRGPGPAWPSGHGSAPDSLAWLRPQLMSRAVRRWNLFQRWVHDHVRVVWRAPQFGLGIECPRASGWRVLCPDPSIVVTVDGAASRALRVASQWPSATLDAAPSTAQAARIKAMHRTGQRVVWITGLLRLVGVPGTWVGGWV